MTTSLVFSTTHTQENQALVGFIIDIWESGNKLCGGATCQEYPNLAAQVDVWQLQISCK